MKLRFSAVIIALFALMLSTPVSFGDGPTVAIIEHPILGPILTGPNGMVLYTWLGDEPGVSRCPLDCVERAWPAYWASEELSGGGRLSTIAWADGRLMYALDGWPLYYGGARDPNPGDANGQGSMGVGALWSVVMVDFSITQ